MCLHKLNKNVLEESIDLPVEHGANSIKTSLAADSGEWMRECGKLNLTSEEAHNVYLDYIPKYLKAGSPITLHLGGFFYCRKGSQNYELHSVKNNCGKK